MPKCGTKGLVLPERIAQWFTYLIQLGHALPAIHFQTCEATTVCQYFSSIKRSVHFSTFDNQFSTKHLVTQGTVQFIPKTLCLYYKNQSTGVRPMVLKNFKSTIIELSKHPMVSSSMFFDKNLEEISNEKISFKSCATQPSVAHQNEFQKQFSHVNHSTNSLHCFVKSKFPSFRSVSFVV